MFSFTIFKRETILWLPEYFAGDIAFPEMGSTLKRNNP